MQSIIRTTRNIHTFIKQSDIQSFKKCRFQAHLYTIETETDVALCQKDITASKKHSKASHPHINGWILSNGVSGFDDNGESGAGKRLLTLLENRNLQNTFVAVTRWYGGSHLGGARFRAITKPAKEIL